MAEDRRVAVVTGGGTGMGRAIAARLAEAGHTVVVTGRRQEVLDRTAAELAGDGAREVIARRCDVGDPDEVDRLAGWLAAEVGPALDVLVNNAGGVEALAPGATTRDAAAYANRSLAANLVGSYLMTYALRPLLRRPGGRVINISSIAAFRGGGDMYSAAKAGVVGLTYSLAADLGPEGITANAVAPGLVLETEFFGDRMTPERLARTVAQTPVGRAGTPDDVAAAVAWLASPEAGFVNGEVLHVNGGWVFGR